VCECVDAVAWFGAALCVWAVRSSVLPIRIRMIHLHHSPRGSSTLAGGLIILLLIMWALVDVLASIAVVAACFGWPEWFIKLVVVVPLSP
jgi:hypothetical protein